MKVDWSVLRKIIAICNDQNKKMYKNPKGPDKDLRI